ncbi:hypothetical protein ABKN59_011468, partial [Abortiporus biennis]
MKSSLKYGYISTSQEVLYLLQICSCRHISQHLSKLGGRYRDVLASCEQANVICFEFAQASHNQDHNQFAISTYIRFQCKILIVEGTSRIREPRSRSILSSQEQRYFLHFENHTWTLPDLKYWNVSTSGEQELDIRPVGIQGDRGLITLSLHWNSNIETYQRPASKLPLLRQWQAIRMYRVPSRKMIHPERPENCYLSLSKKGDMTSHEVGFEYRNISRSRELRIYRCPVNKKVACLDENAFFFEKQRHTLRLKNDYSIEPKSLRYCVEGGSFPRNVSMPGEDVSTSREHEHRLYVVQDCLRGGPGIIFLVDSLNEGETLPRYSHIDAHGLGCIWSSQLLAATIQSQFRFTLVIDGEVQKLRASYGADLKESPQPPPQHLAEHSSRKSPSMRPLTSLPMLPPDTTAVVYDSSEPPSI